MLIDRCVIEVRSGKGGDGAICFLHDKNTEFGGPSGGNGGHGGSIYLIAKQNINTLYNFRHSRVIKAQDGAKGDKNLMNGRDGQSVTVEVPVGTVVTNEATGEILADLKEDGMKVEVAAGGKGGRGNASYKTSRNRCPRIAENGYPSDRKRLILELKLLADAGIIGLPSAGKSTFLNIVTRANAETADYPFTTIEPNLGVVKAKDGRTFVLADMPGLIEGASEGRGLGTKFLRHIERCRVLIHFVSMDGIYDPVEAYETINKELEGYGGNLIGRPQLVVATKMDEEGAEERKAKLDAHLGFKSYPLCAYTYEGKDEILNDTLNLIERTPLFPLKGMEEHVGIKVYDGHIDEGPLFTISNPEPNYFVVEGEKLLFKLSLINIKTEEGIDRMLRYLYRVGVEEELRKMGAVDGDEIQVGDFIFTYEQ